MCCHRQNDNTRWVKGAQDRWAHPFSILRFAADTSMGTESYKNVNELKLELLLKASLWRRRKRLRPVQ